MSLVLFILAVRAFAAPAWLPIGPQCVEHGKMRFIYNKQVRTETGAFCFSSDHSYLFSPDCREGSCAALPAELAKIPPAALRGDVGSPGFKLCRRVGGEPQLLEYQDGEKWWSADRCLFARDGSFVDTGILVKKRSLEGKN